MQLASPFRSCRFGARYEIGTNYFLILEPAPLQHSRPHLESVPILYPVPTVLEPAPLQHSRPHLESVPILYPVPTVNMEQIWQAVETDIPELQQLIDGILSR